MSREEKRVLRHKQRVWSKVANGVQTKYKTLVRFLSVFSRVAVLYPYTMPETFAEQFEKVNFLASLDVALLPVGCLVKTSFHDRLLVVCLVPLVFVACVGLVALLNAARLHFFAADKTAAERRKANRFLQSKCVYVIVIFVFTVFPLVSTTIFQTFQYDQRLGGDSAYLVADYSIQRGDPDHDPYIVFALCMAFLYCVGIPVISFAALRSNLPGIQHFQTTEAELLDLEEEKAAIQAALRSSSFRRQQIALGTDTASIISRVDAAIDERMDELDRLKIEEPQLKGLSPLFQDYKAQYWYFELIQFTATLFFVAIVTTLPTESATQVFIALMISTGMLLTFANLSPYLYQFESNLAQGAQFIVSFALTIGLLVLVGGSDDEDAYGSVLLASVILLLLVALALFVFEFDIIFQLMFPKAALKFQDKKKWLKQRCGFLPSSDSDTWKLSGSKLGAQQGHCLDDDESVPRSIELASFNSMASLPGRSGSQKKNPVYIKETSDEINWAPDPRAAKQKQQSDLVEMDDNRQPLERQTSWGDGTNQFAKSSEDAIFRGDDEDWTENPLAQEKVEVTPGLESNISMVGHERADSVEERARTIL